MKTFSILFLLIGLTFGLSAQNQPIPNEALVDLDGITKMSTTILDSTSPTIVLFWKSGSNKCCDNLETLQIAWMENLQEHGVKFVAICTDCNGSGAHIKPLANGKNWEFDIYIDPNGNFKRAMNVNDVPVTLLFDQDQNLLCRHAGFCAGNEELICDKIIHSIENSVQYTTAIDQ